MPNKMRPLSIVLVILAVLALLSSIKPHEASRVLHEEEKMWMKKENLHLQSLPKGPVCPPPEPDHKDLPGPPCSIKPSTISQKGYASHAMPPPPPPPLV
ncbi:hypothetical protein LOK49_LG12G01430 [Camellia lanceoleosa]|uniref:Uncharacterized protein n=1 Tax=Camellia lanceoleosa TaxID=1840588 RepID=A0ACC0FPG6_9ERIC|nr:hypothetical protein LOK49_LG12G01430 [Camellia lanceoleosa]